MIYSVLENSVPERGRKLTALEATRLSILGLSVKCGTEIKIRDNGFMFVVDCGGRECDVARRRQSRKGRIMNRAILNDIDARLHSRDENVSGDALCELGYYSGTGTPRVDLSRYSGEIGPDYICALDTGDIVAWCAEYTDGFGHDGRELIVCTVVPA